MRSSAHASMMAPMRRPEHTPSEPCKLRRALTHKHDLLASFVDSHERAIHGGEHHQPDQSHFSSHESGPEACDADIHRLHEAKGVRVKRERTLSIQANELHDTLQLPPLGLRACEHIQGRAILTEFSPCPRITSEISRGTSPQSMSRGFKSGHASAGVYVVQLTGVTGTAATGTRNEV